MKFHHAPGIGDVIYGLPVIKYLGGGSLYLDPARYWLSYEDAFLRAKSFFERQPYIDEVVIVYDQSALMEHKFVNLNSFREHPSHETENLVRSHFLGLGLPAPEVIDPWLVARTTEDTYPIVLHRTPRYSGLADYSFLRRLPKNKLFCIGHWEEARQFVEYVGATYLETSTLDDVAAVVNSCGLLIGVQSSPLAIAAGLGKPRMVERSIRWTNCDFSHEHEYSLTDDGELNGKMLEDFCEKVDIGL